ncbi:MAG: tetratricopeptide repeat protein [Blastocatellia bacterium]
MNRRITLPYALAILIALAAAAAAQDLPSNTRLPGRDANNASISGRVMLPSGMTSAAHLKIVLNTPQAPLTTLYSDKNGEFHFDDLPSGTYTLLVTADEAQYEPLSQLIRLKPGEPMYIVLSLKSKLGTPAVATRERVVSVAEDERMVPASARHALEQADKLIDKGDVDAAIVQLNKALALYPDYIRARNRLGVQYLKRRRLPEAAEQFKVILDKNPKYFDARLNFGIVLYEQRHLTEAADELSRAVSLDSSSAAAHLFWGIVTLELNDLIVAERELVKALLLGGERYSNAHYYFAHVYLKTGRREEAAREFTLFLKTAPPGEMAAQARALLQQLTAKN